MKQKTEVFWKTDSAGIVLGARAHDGILTSFSFSEQLLSFRIKRQSGEIVLFELKEVEKLHLTIWEGTILSEVYAWKVQSFPDEAWVIHDNPWNILYQDRAIDVRREAQRTAREKPESLLVHVVCSYGGAIAAICGNVSIYEE